jgi:SNF2 family DNA or RNA helicase
METELLQRLHSIAFRATKAECLDLPETTDIIRYVELEPAAMRVYRDLVKDSYAELTNGKRRTVDTDDSSGNDIALDTDDTSNIKNAMDDTTFDTITATNILTRMLRLSQLTGGFIGDDDGHPPRSISRAKLDALSDIVDEALQEDRKLVIIARFVPEIKAICASLDKQHIKYSLIMGGVTDRNEQVARFQTDPEVRIFVGQIATAGLGITLTAASSLVFYSLDYSMSNFEQAKARIHRVGQKENCTYIYLTARGTIDEKVQKSLREKADLARILVDDYRQGRNPYES